MVINDGHCYGKMVTQGKRKGLWSKHPGVARDACIEHAGPPPFAGAICRHLCHNDTYIIKRTGVYDFVCINPAHIEWNTYSQNTLDAFDNRWGNFIPKQRLPRVRKPYGPRPHCKTMQTPEHKKRMSDKYHNRTPEQVAATAAKISAALKGKKRGPYRVKEKVLSDKPRKQRSDKGVARITPRKKNSVKRSNVGKKNVMSDKPRKQRSDKGKKRGPQILKKVE